MDCPRCLMDDAIPGITIGERQCNVCDAHDAHAQIPLSTDRAAALLRGRDFDGVLGISGGLDSSWLVLWAKGMGLRPLLVHFDNWFNCPEANANVEVVTRRSGFPLVRVYADDRYRQLCRRLLATGLPDADIANDLAMATIVLDVARAYGIGCTVNGHQYRTEGWNPIGWTYMDGKYLRSIAGDVEIQLRRHPAAPPIGVPRYMDFGFWRQFKGIRQVRVYDYLPFIGYEQMRRDVEAWCGWQSYGDKHAENLYTEWVGCWLLPTLHGIDKRHNYLSAEVRCGRMTKAEARDVLAVPMTFSDEKWARLCEGLGFADRAELEAWCRRTPANRDRARFPSYRMTFHRLRPLIWLALKFGMTSKSFYRKYVAGA